MSGYVRIHRALCGHPAFRNDAEAMAFAWLIAKAQWRPTRVRYKERGICLLRGQLAISVRDFAKAMDRDKAWVERLLKRLKSEAMVETRHETGVSVITICNYEQFQTEQDRRKTPDETLGETQARQAQDTEQEREEGKKEDTPPTPRKRGNGERTMIPEDWKVPAVADLPPKARACAEQWTKESYDTHAEAFVSYWRSERKMKADWRGTWANRVISLHSQVMRDQKFGNAPPKVKSSEPVDWEERADWYDKHDRPDDAADCRRRAKAMQIGRVIPFVDKAEVQSEARAHA